MRLFTLLASLLGAVGAASHSMGGYPESYNSQKQVPIFVGRIELDSPFQYFDYHRLPICDFFGVEDSKLANIDDSLGSRLVGHSWVFNPRMPAIFDQNLENTAVCRLSMTSDVIRETSQLVRQGARVTYWIDGLPAVGYIGLDRSGMQYLFKHRHFDIITKDDRIVAVDVEPSEPVQLVLNSRMEMTYSVSFKKAEDMVNSPFDNTTETRYQRYLTMTEADATNMQRLDTFQIVNATGFTCIVSSLAGMIFEKFLGERRPGSSPESAWSVTANLPNISMLRGQVYRRPLHAIIISVFIGLGAQAMVSVAAFAVYTKWVLNEGQLIFRQLDGRLVNPLIGCILGSSFIGGVAGGNFIKAWGIRRSGLAYFAQIGLPFIISAIFLVQLRTISALMGTTLAWYVSDMLQLVGLTMTNAIGHFIGFSGGRYFTTTLESVPPKDDVPQVADVPSEGRFSRAILLCIPPVLASSVVTGPLYYSYRCTITSFCVQENLTSLWLHVLCGWILIASSMVISAYLLLCLGDGRWQWNAARSGVLHGLIQTGLFFLWSIRGDMNASLYSALLAFCTNLLFGGASACISTAICYYSSAAILWAVFDDRKAE